MTDAFAEIVVLALGRSGTNLLMESLRAMDGKLGLFEIFNPDTRGGLEYHPEFLARLGSGQFTGRDDPALAALIQADQAEYFAHLAQVAQQSQRSSCADLHRVPLVAELVSAVVAAALQQRHWHGLLCQAICAQCLRRGRRWRRRAMTAPLHPLRRVPRPRVGMRSRVLPMLLQRCPPARRQPGGLHPLLLLLPLLQRRVVVSVAAVAAVPASASARRLTLTTRTRRWRTRWA